MPDVAAVAGRRDLWTRARPTLLLVLPADKVLAKDLTLPTEDVGEVARMVANEVEVLSPFEPGRTQHGFVTLGHPNHGRTAVRCFLADQAAVAAACEPFDRAAIPICGLVPSPLAGAAGLQVLQGPHTDRLYIICQHGLAESIVPRADGTWTSRVGLLGGTEHTADDLAREILTSLSVLSPAAQHRPRVHIAGLPPAQVQQVCDRLRRLRPASPVDLQAVEWSAPADVLAALQVPAIRLAGALWLQRTEPAQMAQACIVPPAYHSRLQRRRVLRQDLHWVGLCLAAGLLISVALAVGNARTRRLASRIEREISPNVGLASQVAAKREQLLAARRQLFRRDQPLRILAGLADVTPSGIFFYKSVCRRRRCPGHRRCGRLAPSGLRVPGVPPQEPAVHPDPAQLRPAEQGRRAVRRGVPLYLQGWPGGPLMTLSTRERGLVRLVLVAIAALVISRMAWLPLLAERRAARAQLLDAQTRRQSVQRNLLMREAVERDFAGLKDQLQKQRSTEEELGLFLKTLSQMFSGLSLRIGQMRALPSEVLAFHKKHTAQIEVGGPLSSLAGLLQEVSLSKLPIRVERFEVTGGTADGRVDATLWISELVLLEQPAGEGG